MVLIHLVLFTYGQQKKDVKLSWKGVIEEQMGEGSIRYMYFMDATIDPDGAGPSESFSIGNRDFNRVSLRGTGVIRWEWRPGSTLFFVWQQSRSSRNGYGDFDLGRDFDELFAGDANNIFMVKATYWFG